MLSRRELLTAGVAGRLTAAPDSGTGAAGTELQADRAALNDIKEAIDRLNGGFRAAFLTNSLSHGIVSKIRQQMEVFFKSHGKFPDFIEIGVNVFIELYDWHIKNQQQLAVTRGVEGRYSLQFMFTTMVLRPEVDVNYIGVPYDKV